MHAASYHCMRGEWSTVAVPVTRIVSFTPPRGLLHRFLSFLAASCIEIPSFKVLLFNDNAVLHKLALAYNINNVLYINQAKLNNSNKLS